MDDEFWRGESGLGKVVNNVVAEMSSISNGVRHVVAFDRLCCGVEARLGTAVTGVCDRLRGEGVGSWNCIDILFTCEPVFWKLVNRRGRCTVGDKTGCSGMSKI